MRVSGLPRAVLVLIGFTAIIAQIVLMRELMVVFYGNEISLGLVLGNWLLWTSFGSGVLGRLAGRVRNPRRLMAVLQVLVGVTLPMTLVAVRASRTAFQPTPGEVLGPGPMFLTSLVVLSLFCSITGLLFTVGSRTYALELGRSTVEATGSVYWLEAVGSAAGGLLASLLLVRYLGAFEIVWLLSLLSFLAAVILGVKTPRLQRTLLGMVLAIFALFVFPVLSGRLESFSLEQLWRGFKVVATRNSAYGNLAIVETEGTRSLFENGLALSTVPDRASAEEAVHFALLEHPSPRSLLLIGGGVNGSLAQALQHATLERVDYVELDPAIFDLARRYFPEPWAPIASDRRVHTYPIDGRLFLKTTRENFDVIILNLPDPETAQLNRFYTLEFFREVDARLTSGGVFSFQLRGAEDYISPELADFLRCINRTLREVFPQVSFIPGNPVHFFAAQQAGLLAQGPEDLLSRLRARHLETRYVREYYIPYRMTPDRMLDLGLALRPRLDTPVNRDFAPIAYYFDVALWSRRFNSNYRQVFQLVAGVRFGSAALGTGLILLVLAGLLHWLSKADRRVRPAAGLCIAASGFTLMALEVLLLLGFQAIYGYVYQQLAMVIAAFMVGMAAGSWLALGGPAQPMAAGRQGGDTFTLAWLQVLISVSPLLLSAVFAACAGITRPLGLWLVSQVLFPILSVLCGLLGGYQFPIASRVFFGNTGQGSRGAGTLYALDLVGACIGAVGLSAYWVPVFGFLRTAELIAVVNLAPAGLAFLSMAGAKRRLG